MSSREWRHRIEDILDAIMEIQSFVAGATLEQFKTDAKTVKAVAADLMIIGEARHCSADAACARALQRLHSVQHHRQRVGQGGTGCSARGDRRGDRRRARSAASAHQVAVEPRDQALFDVALVRRLGDRVPFLRIDHQLGRHVERLQRVPAVGGLHHRYDRRAA